MRQHYFNLFMMAHLQRATLLEFKARLANALNALRSTATPKERNDEFSRRIMRIETEFLYFRNQYWFTELTNQVQGRELFSLMAKHLETPALFNHIREEIAAGASCLQSRDMAESVKTIADLQTNVEWVELFIVGVYAIELPYAFAHLFHINNPWYSGIAVVLALATVISVACMGTPWKHAGQKSRFYLLSLIAILWVLFLGVFGVPKVWNHYQQKNSSAANNSPTTTNPTKTDDPAKHSD
jgi:hypothetical protein